MLLARIILRLWWIPRSNRLLSKTRRLCDALTLPRCHLAVTNIIRLRPTSRRRETTRSRNHNICHVLTRPFCLPSLSKMFKIVQIAFRLNKSHVWLANIVAVITTRTLSTAQSDPMLVALSINIRINSILRPVVNAPSVASSKPKKNKELSSWSGRFVSRN